MNRLIALLSIAASLPAADLLRFHEHTIATDLKGAYQVVVTDLNRDGKPDLLALASGMPDLLWFEGPGWTRHVLASGFRQMINCAAADTDGDGIPEIVLAHEFSMQAAKSLGIVSLLQHTGDPRAPWKVREIDRIPTAHRIRVANGAFVNAPLAAADAVAPEYRGRTPLVLYRPGAWQRETISTENEGVVHGIEVIDWDRDGREDILTASFGGIHLFRLGRDGRWTRSLLAAGDPAPWPKCGASDVTAGRLGRSRFLATIEPWHGNQVAVYRESGGAWRRTVIDSSLPDAHTIITADLDGDRRDEVVAGFRGQGRSVYIYREQSGRWVRETLDAGGIAAAACAAADLNGDRRTDIVCVGSATANLKWYENIGK